MEGISILVALRIPNDERKLQRIPSNRSAAAASLRIATISKRDITSVARGIVN